jgi:hypothetical protein
MQRSSKMPGMRDGESGLTGFLAEPSSRPEIVRQLDEAGLELWQAPEGFWAIRVKPTAAPTPPARPARRRRLEGRA